MDGGIACASTVLAAVCKASDRSNSRSTSLWTLASSPSEVGCVTVIFCRAFDRKGSPAAKGPRFQGRLRGEVVPNVQLVIDYLCVAHRKGTTEVSASAKSTDGQGLCLNGCWAMKRQQGVWALPRQRSEPVHAAKR